MALTGDLGLSALMGDGGSGGGVADVVTAAKELYQDAKQGPMAAFFNGIERGRQPSVQQEVQHGAELEME